MENLPTLRAAIGRVLGRPVRPAETFYDTAAALDAYVDRRHDLLARYIEHVGSCEGTVFLEGWRGNSGVTFTDAEWELLGELATGEDVPDSSSRIVRGAARLINPEGR